MTRDQLHRQHPIARLLSAAAEVRPDGQPAQRRDPAGLPACGPGYAASRRDLRRLQRVDPRADVPRDRLGIVLVHGGRQRSRQRRHPHGCKGHSISCSLTARIERQRLRRVTQRLRRAGGGPDRRS